MNGRVLLIVGLSVVALMVLRAFVFAMDPFSPVGMMLSSLQGAGFLAFFVLLIVFLARGRRQQQQQQVVIYTSAPAAPIAAPTAGVRRCAKCRHGNAFQAAFCGGCGARLP